MVCRYDEIKCLLLGRNIRDRVCSAAIGQLHGIIFVSQKKKALI